MLTSMRCPLSFGSHSSFAKSLLSTVITFASFASFAFSENIGQTNLAPRTHTTAHVRNRYDQPALLLHAGRFGGTRSRRCTRSSRPSRNTGCTGSFRCTRSAWRTGTTGGTKSAGGISAQRLAALLAVSVEESVLRSALGTFLRCGLRIRRPETHSIPPSEADHTAMTSPLPFVSFIKASVKAQTKALSRNGYLTFSPFFCAL